MLKHAPGRSLLESAYSSNNVGMWSAVLVMMREKLQPKEVKPLIFSLSNSDALGAFKNNITENFMLCFSRGWVIRHVVLHMYDAKSDRP